MVLKKHKRAAAILAPAAMITAALGATAATSLPAMAAGVESVTSPTATVALTGTDTNPANNSVTVTVQPR